MKVLTLTQPWATLVAIGAKRIETRSWSTSYRGPLAIHAGAGIGPVGGVKGLQELCCSEPFQSILRGSGRAHLMDPAFFANNLPRGVIVAVVNLSDVLPTAGSRPGSGGPKYADWVHTLTAQERAFGDYTPGRFAWLLDDRRRIDPPLPYRGGLGLRTVPRATAIDVMQRAV